MVKRLRHRPFTAVTRVRFSSESPQVKGEPVFIKNRFRLYNFKFYSNKDKLMVTKWGFGMAPFKKEQLAQYKIAFTEISNFIENQTVTIDLLNQISLIKGFFNRICKQNQWDWFIAYAYIDFPPLYYVRNIVSCLSELRKSLLDSNVDKQDLIIKNLLNYNFLKYKNNFLTYDFNKEDEYIYILSRREENDLLKIGRTSRNIIKRVNEINSATGIAYPYSARMAYKVTNSYIAEKSIHTILQQFRLRNDREFFKLSFKDACKLIEDCLKQKKLWKD